MQLLDFIVRRLFFSIFVFLGLSIVIFLVSRILPGNPVRLMLGPYATSEQVFELEEKLGLHHSLAEQYLRYMQGLLRGDLGMSLQTRRNVSQDLLDYFPATAELVIVAMIWITVLGVSIGVASAKYQNSLVDSATRIGSSIGVVMPAFFLALLLQLILGMWLRVLPITGRLSPMLDMPNKITGLLLLDSLIQGEWSVFGDAFLRILLPSFSLALAGVGQVVRVTRASMLDVKDHNYIQFADVLGVRTRTLYYRLALKPASIPILTLIGLEFSVLMGEAFLIEQVFVWPGMAKYGIRAIIRKDFNAVMGVVLLIGVIFIVTNFVVDLINGSVDPRVRIKQHEEG